VETAVLAYSGGLDTSCAVKWIKDNYGLDVVAVVVDVGQGENLRRIRDKALAIGAKDALIFDKRREFVDDFILPALKANALYEGVYPLVSSLSRPLIARTVVAVAEGVEAKAVAHGCTGKGNDQVRFEVCFNILAPSLQVIAPIREWAFSRNDLIEYARANKIPVPASKKSPYSIDANLWGRSIESGVLEDPGVEPPEDVFRLTRSPLKAPDKPSYVEVEFQGGVPVALDGDELDPVELIGRLGAAAGAAGFGRIDHVESRLVGIKSREIYEVPAALSLIEAHRALEFLTLPKDLLHLKRQLEGPYARLVYFGEWFSPQFNALQAFMDETQHNVTGAVRLKFYKGGLSVAGRKSAYAIYREDLATYGEGDAFDHGASRGFIKIFGLENVLYEQIRRTRNGWGRSSWAKENGPAAAARRNGAPRRNGMRPSAAAADPTS
jgi:argininosuccinate synthase